MIGATQPAGRTPAHAALGTAGYAGLLFTVGTATVIAVMAGNGNAVLAVLPVALVAIVYLAAKVPLRWSTTVLLLLLLCPDDSGDVPCPGLVECRWRSPFLLLGDLMHYRIDAVAHIPGLAISGMEVVLLFLFGVWIYRKTAGAQIDVRGQVQSATVLRDMVLLYFVAVCYAEANGLAHGGQFAPWKLRNLLHPLALYFLFQAAYRPHDHPLLGRIIVFTAAYRAVLAVIVQVVARERTGGALANATNHGDSILFSVAIFLLLADLMEQASRRRLFRATLVIPIIMLGMVENNRRLAWVMLAMMLLLAYLVSPMKGWKRSLTRVAIVAMPIIALYVAVGWNREGSIFAPLRTFRSVSDTSVDHSAYWREVENWNIAVSMRERPLLGIGLGKEYTLHMQTDDIGSAYKEFREWPHNTVLALLLFMGLFAFTASWCLYAVVVFLAVRSYRLATVPGDRVAALGCLAAMIACYAQAWGDTGAHYPQYKIFVALALAVSGKLAVATGAWPAAARRSAAASAPAAEASG